jgi:protein-S-isoprenylcysteine O-methyltransferase Ste14
MNIIGKTTIHPILFYTGKISGYFTWIIFILNLTGIKRISTYTAYNNKHFAFLILFIALFFVVQSLINLGSSTRLGLPSEETKLKTNGIYKISRNPMYLGFNLLTLASMIYTLNVWIIIPGIYSIAIYHLIILGEEIFLENRFGINFLEYKKKTRRYL